MVVKKNELHGNRKRRKIRFSKYRCTDILTVEIESVVKFTFTIMSPISFLSRLSTIKKNQKKTLNYQKLNGFLSLGSVPYLSDFSRYDRLRTIDHFSRYFLNFLGTLKACTPMFVF